MADLIIRNAGMILTGDVAQPVLNADTIVVTQGRIESVGPAATLADVQASAVIDARGAAVLPGLVDSHVHPVLGDFTPRQRMLDFIEGCLHGGVTSMISAGEVHTPGRPRDASGTKALAILAHKSFSNLRPAHVKVHGGAVLLEHGLQERDFAEMAAEGVCRVGEIGVSSVNQVEEARQMVEWAHRYGMKVIVHTGGASVPGSSVIGADFVLAVRPDVAGHVNGGPTAPPLSDVERILSESDAAIEVVQCGNVRALRDVIQLADRRGALDRVVVGTDSPSGTGVIPLGMLRTISWIASLAGVPGDVAIALATGNTARVHGLETGTIAPGREADLLIADAPVGSSAENVVRALEIGDTPAISVAMIDGVVRVYRSRNTPPPVRSADVPWMTAGGH
jgi:enamidase